MGRKSFAVALIVLHLLTIVQVTGARAQEEWLIRHQPVLSAQPDQPIEIGAELEGRATGVLMYIMARKTGQKDFRSFAMKAAGASLFEGQIPAKWSTTEGVEYYLRLQDPVGRVLARYPEDETFLEIDISAAEPEEMVTPAEEPRTEPQPEQAEIEAAAPPAAPTEPTETVEAPVPEEEEALPPAEEEEMAQAPEEETKPQEPEQAVAPAEEPEQEAAEAPPIQPAVEEEPTPPTEKPVIVMEEKKGGLKTWHWLGLGALAVVGIAAVAMSGGDEGKGNGGTPSSKLPDPPDHP